MDDLLNNLLDNLTNNFNDGIISCLIDNTQMVNIDQCISCQSNEYYNSTSINYSCAIKKNIYMLRYMVVHIKEITSILDRIDIKHFINKPLKILSIGGGSGIDILAFNYWINSKLDTTPEINYTVIDKENWGNIFNIVTSMHTCNTQIHHEYISSDTQLEDDYDLVIMSYLLSELDSETIEIVWNKIGNNKIIIINDRSEVKVLETMKNKREETSSSDCECFNKEHCRYTFPFEDKTISGLQLKIFKNSCGCIYYNDN